MNFVFSLLSGKTYGGYVYYNNLLPALARNDTDNVYIIVDYHGSSPIFDSLPDNFRYIYVSRYLKNSGLRFLWEQIIFPWYLLYLRADRYFTGKNIGVLIRTVPFIISIRNVEPFFYEDYENEFIQRLKSNIRYRLTKYSIRHAERIIAVSEYTKKLVIDRDALAGNRIDVVYNGNPIEGSVSAYPTVLNNSENYIVNASKFVPYANQMNLVRAYHILEKTEKTLPRLYLAGGVLDGEYYAKVLEFIREHDLNRKISILGLVEHEELMRLVSLSKCFVFPSMLEACPHTLIEVMSLGVACTVSNCEPMPEICLDAAIYFDPYEPTSIAMAIEKTLHDEELKSKLRDAARLRSTFFSWDKSAKAIIKCLTETQHKN